MASIDQWSRTAAGNGPAAGPPDWPKEGMDKSDVNDTMRENMASLRDWYQDPTWVNPFNANDETITVAKLLRIRGFLANSVGSG